MSRRLRELAERPVAPGVARAIVSTALMVTVGLGCLVALGVGGHRDSPAGHDGPGSTVARPLALAPTRPTESAGVPTVAGRLQDPQDRPRTRAHRRAARELASHRALQHVPWRGRTVTIRLVGAEGGDAVLSVLGPTLAADRRGWRSFLRRFQDDGRAYQPRFRTTRGPRTPRACAQTSASTTRALAGSNRVREGVRDVVLGGVQRSSRLSPLYPHGNASCGVAEIPRSPRHTKADH